MAIRLAFVGFRHGHIHDLYRRAQAMPEIEVIAACEDDAATRAQLLESGQVTLTHHALGAMLADVACDAVAIGDYYARRGALAIEALSHGKHVISDKPLCTDLGELDEIERLVARHGLQAMCMLDMRDSAHFRGVRQLIRDGAIGEIHAIAFGGQHPLLLGKRPHWYFEPGKHGGTINDIAIHAIDAIPWITGLRFVEINAARCWNAFAPEFPHFEDAGQMMLTMANGCGVLGDVSYFAPDSSGYTSPFYWRTTFWGRDGVIETSATADVITVARSSADEIAYESLPDGNPGGYLASFVRNIAGTQAEDELSTAQSLRSTRTALLVQQAADSRAYGIALD
ncbi:MAG: Gfo/Idh/MocA family oxidoreductase [Anaerolineae bacterium]|nr:Gfo/Idh/MocA family oxidoreductase [Anaerolineae bacterium]